MNSRRQSSGFTLLELLIVVMIIGILAILAYVGTVSYANRAKASEARNNIGSVKRLVETEFSQSGTVPSGSAATAFPNYAISGKYYEDFTITGTCDASTGRFQGTIAAVGRSGSPTGLTITFNADGSTSEAGFP